MSITKKKVDVYSYGNEENSIMRDVKIGPIGMKFVPGRIEMFCSLYLSYILISIAN